MTGRAAPRAPGVPRGPRSGTGSIGPELWLNEVGEGRSCGAKGKDPEAVHRPRVAIRHPRVRSACKRIEGGPELVVAIANQEPWRGAEGGRVAKLLRHPRLRREPCRRCEHDFAGGNLDEDEREDRAEEHVVGLQEVARPGLTGVVSEESRPRGCSPRPWIGPARPSPERGATRGVFRSANAREP